MMKKEFQMSMMGELTFFLGIQVKEMKQGTFVHQVKYTKDLIKKFVMVDAKPVSTPMSMMIALDPNEDGECHIPKFSFRNVNHFSHKKLKISKKNSFILT
jgi:hypothetical protein